MAMGRKASRFSENGRQGDEIEGAGEEVQPDDDQDAPQHLHGAGAAEQDQQGVEQQGHDEHIDDIGEAHLKGAELAQKPQKPVHAADSAMRRAELEELDGRPRVVDPDHDPVKTDATGSARPACRRDGPRPVRR